MHGFLKIMSSTPIWSQINLSKLDLTRSMSFRAPEAILLLQKD